LKELTLYRQAHHLPEMVHHEGAWYPVYDNTEDENQAAQAEDATPGIYDEETAESFLVSIKHVWDSMKRGNPPDVALCELLRDKLISEVTGKIDQIQYLSQLRVRDHYTYSHTLHVSALSIALAQKIGMDKDQVQEVALAAILHDLGKLLIPESIMFKASRLTEKEFEVMKLHPKLGYDIICETLKLPEHIALPALEHQEMYGGGGYPYNKRQDEIHPYSQIVKVADVYDALTAKRPYKDGIPSQKAVGIMVSEGEKSFNPDLLNHFVEIANYQPDPPAAPTGPAA
jgi:putative nucleotidyltransferase with HDIG domain